MTFKVRLRRHSGVYILWGFEVFDNIALWWIFTAVWTHGWKKMESNHFLALTVQTRLSDYARCLQT